METKDLYNRGEKFLPNVDTDNLVNSILDVEVKCVDVTETLTWDNLAYNQNMQLTQAGIHTRYDISEYAGGHASLYAAGYCAFEKEDGTYINVTNIQNFASTLKLYDWSIPTDAKYILLSNGSQESSYARCLILSGKSSVNNIGDNSIKTKYYNKGFANKELQQEKKICIITAGQSNARGATRPALNGSEMPEYLANALPLNNCHFVENLKMLTGTPSQIEETIASFYNDAHKAFYPFDYDVEGRDASDRWGFDAITYYDIAIRANQEFYVIKTSKGETGIDVFSGTNYFWTPDFDKLDNLNQSMLLHFERNIRWHKELYGNNFEIRAMIWHQGEGDYTSPSRHLYYDNLKKVVAYIRGVVGNPSLDIIVGGISSLSSQFSEDVHTAQVRLDEEDPHFHFIEVGAAPMQLDATIGGVNYYWHFNKVSCEYLGHKIYDKLVDLHIVDGEKVNPVKNWE